MQDYVSYSGNQIQTFGPKYNQNLAPGLRLDFN